MIFQQYRYPFPNKNGIFTIEKPENATGRRLYRQIGIEHPHSIPIFKLNEYNLIDDSPKKIVYIQPSTTPEDEDKRYFYILEKDIYEVALHGEVETIKIKLFDEESNNRYLIINVAYEIAD